MPLSRVELADSLVSMLQIHSNNKGGATAIRQAFATVVSDLAAASRAEPEDADLAMCWHFACTGASECRPNSQATWKPYVVMALHGLKTGLPRHQEAQDAALARVRGSVAAIQRAAAKARDRRLAFQSGAESLPAPGPVPLQPAQALQSPSTAATAIAAAKQVVAAKEPSSPQGAAAEATVEASSPPGAAVEAAAREALPSPPSVEASQPSPSSPRFVYVPSSEEETELVLMARNAHPPEPQGDASEMPQGDDAEREFWDWFFKRRRL